jgi:hypothetical protein
MSIVIENADAGSAGSGTALSESTAVREVPVCELKARLCVALRVQPGDLLPPVSLSK